MERKTIIAMALALTLTGCTSYDYDEAVRIDDTVNVDMALLVTSQPSGQMTRMSSDILQVDKTFRGIQNVTIIPFNISTSQVKADDQPWLTVVTESQKDQQMTKSNYLFFKGCTFSQGVNAFLFYGQAARENTGKPIADNNKYGALVADFNGISEPDKYRFNLVRRWPDTSVIPEEAQELADYLTDIANAQANGLAWKDTKQPLLQALFENHINKTTDKDHPYNHIAGSKASIQAHVKQLQKSLEEAKGLTEGALQLKKAILDKIGTGVPSTINYPTSVGLPDGAAVVLWDGTAFMPLTQATTLAGITPISRFTYPAELWYYANSRIKASQEADETPHDPSIEQWSSVLSKYNIDNATINGLTKAVVLKEPAQYAVARLEIKLKKDVSVLKDAEGKAVAVNADDFPLTGIIVGGQYPVGYNFAPAITPADKEFFHTFIYDGQLKTTADAYISIPEYTDAPTTSVNSLVLQSYDNEDIPVVLEFQNNSGQTFRGTQKGVVRPGTKFYLMGKIQAPTYDPAKGDYTRRVFTQDYITSVTFKIQSLANAYNVLPDMLQARFELGVQVVTDWVQSTTSYTILH